ncbi:hypothetical protein [Sulfuricaulis sp.]|jgi:hypothetical protein|uniref:hypothetical protein n=1 Tax=Sulfuricaulis sp. TaxID=2003553 RepID=UPI003559C58C
MEFEYAYNYWKKSFVDSSDGHFTKQDFDKWFRNGARHATDALGFFPTVDSPGSKEHFDILMRQGFISMLEACADGRFGK